MRLTKKLGITCLLLLNVFAVQAVERQPSYFVLGEDEFQGMDIYGIIQRADHTYWIATDRGLFCYDYYTFKKVKQRQSNGSALFGFKAGPDTSVYCHNLNNQIFKIKGDSCALFYELKDDEKSSDIHLLVDGEGNLVVIGSLVLRFNKNGEKKEFTELPKAYYGYPYLLKDGSFIFYCSTTRELIRVDGDQVNKRVDWLECPDDISGVPYFFSFGDSLYAIHSGTHKILKIDPEKLTATVFGSPILDDRLGYLRFYNSSWGLWIASNNRGVGCFNCDFSREIPTWYPELKITYAYEDREGNMLLGTVNHGILVITDMNIPDVLDLPEEFEIVSVRQDDDYGTLAGTSDGHLLAIQNDRVEVLDSRGIDPMEHVFSWPGFPYILLGNNMIATLDRKTREIVELDSRALKDAILVDEKELWIATNIGLFKVQPDFKNASPKYEGVLFNRCFALAYDTANAAIYVAGSDGLKYITQDSVITPVLYGEKPVFAVDIEYHKGAIYAATNSSGIVIIREGKVESFFKPESHNEALAVSQLKAHNNHFFAITSEGFVITSESGVVLAQLDYFSGLIPGRVFDFDVHGNLLWVAHSKGIQILEIDRLIPQQTKPQLLLTGVSVNDRLVNAADNPVFGPEDRKFVFTLSVPTLRNREAIRYHYWLEGYETKRHINAYQDHEIVYNALGSGRYTFHVFAEKGGVLGEEITYQFEISPPIYLRWWFLVGVGLILLMLLYFLYRYQLRRQQAKADLINQVNISKLAAIRSQMNPHFLFNSLNSIQDLILKGDVDNSYKSISHFSDMIRRALNYSDKEFIDLEDEIGLIELYLGLEKLRFRSTLQIDMHTISADDIEIPPMMIQPFIENALIHGLLHKEGERLLTIRFELQDTLRCIIEDNGIGMKKSAEIRERQQKTYESFSGKAIRQRFKILTQQYGSKIGFVREDILESGQVAGTRVIIDIPYRRKF